MSLRRLRQLAARRDKATAAKRQANADIRAEVKSLAGVYSSDDIAEAAGFPTKSGRQRVHNIWNGQEDH